MTPINSDLDVPVLKGRERWARGKRCPPNPPSYEILGICQGVKTILLTDWQRIPVAWAVCHPSVWRRSLRFCTYMPDFCEWPLNTYTYFRAVLLPEAERRLHCSERRIRLSYVKYAQQGQGLIAAGWRVLDPHLPAIHNILHSQASEMPAWHC